MRGMCGRVTYKVWMCSEFIGVCVQLGYILSALQEMQALRLLTTLWATLPIYTWLAGKGGYLREQLCS